MSVQPSAKPRARLAFVDGARALAALYVLAHHCWWWAWDPARRPFPPASAWALSGWLFYGHFAVGAFIAISGFSLMLPIVRSEDGRLPGGVLTFFRRRAKRILPPYYFALALTLYLIWLWIGTGTNTPWDYGLPVSGQDVIAHVLLVHDFWPLNDSSHIDGPMWSIAVEAQIYLLFPLLVLFVRRIGALVTVAAVVVAANIGYFETLHLSTVTTGVWATEWFQLRQVIDYIGLFALGMLGAVIAFSPRPFWTRVRSLLPWDGIGVLLFVGLCAFFARQGEGWVWPVPEYTADLLVVGSVLSLFVAGARAPSGIVSRVLGWRPLAFVGTFSYSIYLMHAPLLAFLYQYLVYPIIVVPTHLGSLRLLVLLLGGVAPLVVGGCYLFHLACERPFLNTAPTARSEAPSTSVRQGLLPLPARAALVLRLRRSLRSG